jgi:hypothetical protein
MKAWLAARLQTLDESIKQTIKKDKQCMGKEFKGFAIPSVVDTPEGRKCVREGYQLKRNDCFVADYGSCDIEVSCSKCIACINSGDAVRKREVFMQYDREFPVEGEAGVPELKPGMVVKTGPRACFLIASERKNDYLIYRYIARDNGDLLLGDALFLAKGDLSVEAIYGDTVLGWLSSANLRSIYRGEETHLIWKKPEPVKEMTVDEISKALGYKVKVVGSEKADD